MNDDLRLKRAHDRSSDSDKSAIGNRQPTMWRSLDELARTKEFEESLHREFPPHASEWLGNFNRRDFLKIMGASVALAGLTSCTRQPSEKIVPYVKQPEEIIPGKPLFFATAMTLGGFATGLLAESHEGHPTKIEGNPDHPMSLGATNIFHQAALLDLYDPDRAQAVLNNGEISSWESFLSALHEMLEIQQTKRGAGLRILTETVTSPTLHAQIQAALKKFPDARWHQFEPANRDNPREGARLAFGEIAEPQYHFDKARVVLALDSDFMFSHPAALRYTRDFSSRRRVAEQGGTPAMNRLYVVESTPSVTGSNADHRLALSPDEIAHFAFALGKKLGVSAQSEVGNQNSEIENWIAALVSDLQQNRGESIVIVGENQPPQIHALAHALNQILGNFDATIHFTATAEPQPVNQVESLRELVSDLKNGAVDVLLIIGGNPAFTAPADFEFAKNLALARQRIHLSADSNETSARCNWHIPQNHFLESWSDARAYDGTISIVQPLILPLYAGKSAHEILDAVLQPQPRSDYEIVREFWQSQNRWPDFENGWRRALHDGLIADSALPRKRVELNGENLRDLQNPSTLTNHQSPTEILFRPDPTIQDGRFANNGWLQELPKAITKLTWDNAALVSPALAAREKLSSGDVVEIEFQNRKLRLPVWITPGQAENCITIHFGNGRANVGRVGKNSGFNAYPLRASDAMWSARDVKFTKTGGRYQLVTTQTQHVIDSEERQIFREGTLDEFLKNPDFVQQDVEQPPRDETLFNPHEHDYDGYRWGMAIDLSACIGCSACVLACQSENNIPVVGKDQVARGRVMHWIRVDTYFSGAPESPRMKHQPVPCMQCENAPCELVCPVGATLHDHEGLNLQVYNRCIGTRYCSNNCPYKVRRFNFYQYADYHTPSLKPMRNPNVTVRWRGVMEKCTYCIQRISAARIQSKIDDRKIRDGEIKTACQQVCPAEAIIFGDLSDPNSRVSKWKSRSLNFSMLGELNTRPRTTYLAKLRNPNPGLSSKLQIPDSKQTSNSKFQTALATAVLGLWTLGFLWNLSLGIGNFSHGGIA
jgi:MoCo/4Fe-4S cofactor protein with predicted Tat translocation signal